MRGQIDEAIAHYGKALEINPNDALAHCNLGVMLARNGSVDEAMDHFQQTLKIKPDYPGARANLGIVESRREELLKALAKRRELLRSRPDDVALLNETAWLLATNPNKSIRNGPEAVKLAQRAVRLSDARQPAVLGTLAAAYAETGQFTDAVRTAQQALALASTENKVALVDALGEQLKLYRVGSPYRQMQQPKSDR
jgi:Flp pilus assembly protein TadD